MKSNIRFKN